MKLHKLYVHSLFANFVIPKCLMATEGKGRNSVVWGQKLIYICRHNLVMELLSRRRSTTGSAQHAWNGTVYVLLILFRFVINTTGYHLGRYSLHLILLKSSMTKLLTLRWPPMRTAQNLGSSNSDILSRNVADLVVVVDVKVGGFESELSWLVIEDVSIDNSKKMSTKRVEQFSGCIYAWDFENETTRLHNFEDPFPYETLIMNSCYHFTFLRLYTHMRFWCCVYKHYF